MRGERQDVKPPAAPVVDVEPEAPPPPAPSGRGPMRIERGGWRPLTSLEKDPGSGFYRFDAKDVPHWPGERRDGVAIEVFGESLAAAQVMLAVVVRQRISMVAGRQEETRKALDALPRRLEVVPVAHRATRLCKRARQARGEA